MARTQVSDPLRSFKFQVVIPARSASPQLPWFGFASVSGLSVQNEVTPYREGGDNTTTRKLPGQTDFTPITLSRGLAVGSRDEWNWFRELFSFVLGFGTGRSTGNFRTDFVINVLDHPVTLGQGSGAYGSGSAVKAKYTVYNAWPMGLAYSDLDAGGSGILVEQMTLAHEGFNMDVAQGNAYLPM